MATLDQLLSSLSTDDNRRGHEFERVAKWFLLNDPVQKAQFRKVWLWDEWPDTDGPDIGIDLVAERRDRSLVAVQVKCYAAEYQVPKREIDSFLSASSQERFAERLLIATCDLGRNARRTIEAQDRPVHALLRSDLEHSPVAWPTSPTRLLPWKPKPRRPRPHQKRAIRDVTKGFEQSDRGQLIMACGTGKTLTSLWIAEALEAKRTLVLVPSLSLLAQTVREWKLSDARSFEFLAVCSDQTVVDEDAMVAHTADLPFTGVTTDPVRIGEFLRGHGPRVLFSTYQSSPRIEEAQALPRVPAFDLAIADEAHRCAGKVDEAFGAILQPETIRARRRLFTTATPRIANGRLKRAAAEYDFEISSMDDKALFGKVLHRLSFGEAIERNLLADYQVVIIFVDDEEVRDYVDRGLFVRTDDGAVRDARTLAAQIGLAKAMMRFGLHRMVTFHSYVNLAARFAAALPEVIDWMPKGDRPAGKVWTAHVSGQMPSGQRDRLLRRLAATSGSGRAILSNARCLTEGVDVPTLDGVAFVDPKRSQVDVVQAVGRAIRKAEDKKLGTIVLPVFLTPDDNPAEELVGSVFEPVVKVLRALRDHDEELTHELDELRVELGRRGTVARLPAKIKIIAPTRVGEDFARAFRVRTVELATPSWGFWFGLLQGYCEREGDSVVPLTHRERGHRLGSWVNKQRDIYRRGHLSEERADRLAALPGWVWNTRDALWELKFASLQRFVESRGHARVPVNYRDENGFTLAVWAQAQRLRHRQGVLGFERTARLEALRGWTWEPHSDRWQLGFASLQRFVAREGQAVVHGDFVDEDGFPLGQWVESQRTRRGDLDQKRVHRLAALPGWVWGDDDRWERGFRALERYVAREGNALVPASHREDGFGLGRWVRKQRSAHLRGALCSDRVARLQACRGWVWREFDYRWEQGFISLQRFVARERHARVPSGHLEDGYPLATWVIKQRAVHRRRRLSEERVARLEALPGWTWNSKADLWELKFASLQRFASREGHARVPVAYRDEAGLALGPWVATQRAYYKRDDLGQQQINRLEALPGWVWDASTSKRQREAVNGLTT